jgi:hypothetical protein
LTLKKLMNQKIDFIYVKATEGEDFVDPKFWNELFECCDIADWVLSFFQIHKSGKSHKQFFK